jgi:predicted nucleic acid-binding protein
MMDTGGFLTLANNHDPVYDEARRCLEQVAAHRLPVFVTVPIIHETQRRLLYDFNRRVAAIFLQRIYDGSVNIIKPNDDDDSKAREIIERHHWLDLTLTDAVNMAVMNRLGILACFSFDQHYPQVGFLNIPPFHL